MLAVHAEILTARGKRIDPNWRLGVVDMIERYSSSMAEQKC